MTGGSVPPASSFKVRHGVAVFQGNQRFGGMIGHGATDSESR